MRCLYRRDLMNGCSTTFNDKSIDSHAYDNIGNVTKYIDESGNVVAAYEYDDFGMTISQSGQMAEVFRHRFSTKYYDSETGLYYYGYRFYSPALMRWLNRDPIEEEGGLNLYGFCGNMTFMYVDVLGLGEYAVSPDEFFSNSVNRKKRRISNYVDVAFNELESLRLGVYHYRVEFVPRFTPPVEIESRRIKQSKFSQIMLGDANVSLGCNQAKFSVNPLRGDFAASNWGPPTVSENGISVGGVSLGSTYQYDQKAFRFGYLSYKQERPGLAFVSYVSNKDMYNAWRLGGLNPMLYPDDIALDGQIEKCSTIVLHYGDAGYLPTEIVISPRKER